MIMVLTLIAILLTGPPRPLSLTPFTLQRLAAAQRSPAAFPAASCLGILLMHGGMCMQGALLLLSTCSLDVMAGPLLARATALLTVFMCATAVLRAQHLNIQLHVHVAAAWRRHASRCATHETPTNSFKYPRAEVVQAARRLSKHIAHTGKFVICFCF